MLLKGKSLNPAYPCEVCEVKTHKQWRVLIFHNKKKKNHKRKKKYWRRTVCFFPKVFPSFICCWNWDTSWDDPSKQSCSPVRRRTEQSRYADFSPSMLIVATGEVNHRPERLRGCEALCGRGSSQRGTESSAVNYAGQLLDALMHSVRWEPALCCNAANL